MGDRAIGVIANIVMIWWYEQLTSKFEDLKIVAHLLKIYVDDVNGLYDPIEAGLDFEEGKLTYSDDKAEEDEEVPADIRTMRIIRKVANSIDPMIQMTIDAPSNHADLKILICLT